MTTFQHTRIFLWVLLIFCTLTSPLMAQQSKPIDYDTVVPQRLNAMLGLQTLSGLEAGGVAWSIVVERPVSVYRYVGVQFNFYQEAYDDYNSSFFNGSTSYDKLLRSSFEACLYYKRFVSGKYTGRKGGLYYAPELRLGQMHYQFNLITPVGLSTEIETRKYFMTSLGLRMGIQKEIDNLILDFGLSIGLRQSRKPVDSTANRIRLEWDNYASPVFSMGFKF